MTSGEKGDGGDAGFCPGLSGADLLLVGNLFEFWSVLYEEKITWIFPHFIRWYISY